MCRMTINNYIVAENPWRAQCEVQSRQQRCAKFYLVQWSRTCFRLLLQFSPPPGQALAAILLCDGLQWWSLSCDQCSGLWGFQRSCTSLILTGTPRRTTPTPSWRGPRSCCLLSIILRFVTLLKWLLQCQRYPLQLAIAAGTWEKVCGCDQEGL